MLRSLKTIQIKSLWNETIHLELSASFSGRAQERARADRAKSLVKMVGSWHAQEAVFVMLQDRLPEER